MRRIPFRKYLRTAFIIGIVFCGASYLQQTKKFSAIERMDNIVSEKPIGDSVTTDQLLAITVASKDNKYLARLKNSVVGKGFNLKVLRAPTFTKNADKLIYQREFVAKYKDDETKIILFTDNDVMYLGQAQEVLEKFKRLSNCKILFGAEYFWWIFPPEAYPPNNYKYKCLNSGMFMGYAPYLYRLLSDTQYEVRYPGDQPWFIENYLNATKRREYGMCLDHRAEIFQNLMGEFMDLELKFDGRRPFVYNFLTNTTPSFLHSQASDGKYLMDPFANYIPNEWNPIDGCLSCLQDTKDLSLIPFEKYPTIVVGLIIPGNLPSAKVVQLLNSMIELSYPKERMHLIISAEKDPQNVTSAAMAQHSKDYASLEIHREMMKPQFRTMAVEQCAVKQCDYFLHLESTVKLEKEALRRLVEQNRPVVGAALKGPNYTPFRKSEFHPSLKNIGNQKGLWMVLLMWDCYLIRGDVISNEKTRPSWTEAKEGVDLDEHFKDHLLANEIDMWLSNRFEFGRYI